MEEHYFASRGIYYRVNKFQPNRRTLVFVHGLSGSSSAWQKYEEYFLKKYNILSFDLRGHGMSIKPKSYQDYKLSLFVEDLFELIKHVNIQTYILVSHSFGALIALEFLAVHQAAHQRNVIAAVFLSPGYEVGKRLSAKIIKWMLSLLLIFKLFPPLKRTGKHIDYRKYPDSGDWNVRRMIADVANTSLRVYLYCSKQSYGFDREYLLGKLNMPVLLIHGRKDTIFPVENSVFMAEKINDSKLILIDNADHIIVLNNFTEVSRSIEEFVDGLVA